MSGEKTPSQIPVSAEAGLVFRTRNDFGVDIGYRKQDGEEVGVGFSLGNALSKVGFIGGAAFGLASTISSAAAQTNKETATPNTLTICLEGTAYDGNIDRVEIFTNEVSPAIVQKIKDIFNGSACHTIPVDCAHLSWNQWYPQIIANANGTILAKVYAQGAGSSYYGGLMDCVVDKLTEILLPPEPTTAIPTTTPPITTQQVSNTTNTPTVEQTSKPDNNGISASTILAWSAIGVGGLGLAVCFVATGYKLAKLKFGLFADSKPNSSGVKNNLENGIQLSEISPLMPHA